MHDFLYIGFDFSMNKPAMSILYKKHLHFYIWPLKLDKNKCVLYSECGVNVTSRNLDAITTKSSDASKNSDLVIKHTQRSADLANMIIGDIKAFIKEHNVNLHESPMYIATEGLSFGSKGDAALNLASYKGVLLVKLYEEFKECLYGLYTYPPISIKSVAGCAGRLTMKDKKAMINAFMRDTDVHHPFKDALINNKLVNKTNYIPCVDDIVDSYWALKTMLKKEEL